MLLFPGRDATNKEINNKRVITEIAVLFSGLDRIVKVITKTRITELYVFFMLDGMMQWDNALKTGRNVAVARVDGITAQRKNHVADETLGFHWSDYHRKGIMKLPTNMCQKKRWGVVEAIRSDYRVRKIKMTRSVRNGLSNQVSWNAHETEFKEAVEALSNVEEVEVTKDTWTDATGFDFYHWTVCAFCLPSTTHSLFPPNNFFVR